MNFIYLILMEALNEAIKAGDQKLVDFIEKKLKEFSTKS